MHMCKLQDEVRSVTHSTIVLYNVLLPPTTSAARERGTRAAPATCQHVSLSFCHAPACTDYSVLVLLVIVHTITLAAANDHGLRVVVAAEHRASHELWVVQR